jgi:adenine-specific DNA-methyltransferase
MQKLELTWIGKGQEPIVEPRILLGDPKKCFGAPNTPNMLIHGDNLLALKALEQGFAGKVKCIYIDPPYNTGSAFSHYDDNLEHSIWLSLMVPRLKILRNLLMDDGSIWISIDDDEGHYLKLLCDEVFGRQNFIATCIWEKKYSAQANTQWLTDSHDFILVYAKNKTVWRPNLLPRTESMDEKYKNPDNDPRGVWKAGDCSISLTGGQRGAQYAKTGVSANIYELTTPSGRKLMPPAGSCWRFSKERFKELIDDNRIWFGKNGDRVPAMKRFLTEVKQGATAKTIWFREEVGDNQEAKREAIASNSESVFATPKPERLIERVLTLATNPGDLVLDSFLGSGTTAVVAHKMRRRWIGVEFGDHCYTHCLPRLQKVVDGEKGGISKAVGWTGGGGFRFYELAPTLIVKDENGLEIISDKYSPAMLAAAVAKLCGYRYAPRRDNPYIHGENGTGGYIFVTTQFVTPLLLDEIAKKFHEGQKLTICASAFQPGIGVGRSDISLRKIPQSVLAKCEYGAEHYNLNIVDMPEFTETEEDFENAD